MRPTIVLTILTLSAFFCLFSPLPLHSEEPAQPEQNETEPTLPTLLDRGIDHLRENRYDDALKIFMQVSRENPDDYRPYLYAAIAFHLKRDLPFALRAIKRAAELAPDEPAVYLRMGMILEGMRDFTGARDSYTRALKTPEAGLAEESPAIKETKERLKRLDIRIYFDAAKGFLREKRYEEAIKELESLLSINPNDYLAYYMMGTALAETEKPKEAVDALKKAVEINPALSDAYLEMGFIYEKAAALEEAAGSFEKFLSLNPKSPKAEDIQKRIDKIRGGIDVQEKFELTGNLIKEEKWDEALRENMALAELQPDHPNVFYNFGLIYANLERYEESVSSLKKALEKKADFFLARQRLAIVYDAQGKFSEAIKEYEAAQTLTKDEEEKRKIQERLDILRPIVEVPERAEKVKELIEKGDIEGAIVEAQNLIAGRKRDPRVYLILGGIYVQANRMEEAVSVLEAGARLDPKNVEIRTLLAEVYERLGREEETLASYKTLAAIAKDTPVGKAAMEKARVLETKIHFDRAKEMKDRGDIEGSLKETTAILTISPDHPIALFNAGVLHDLLDHPRQAEAFLRKAVGVAPDYVEAYLQLGLLFERERRFPEAENAYRNVVTLQREGDASNLAMERLKGLKELAEVSERIKGTLSLMEKKDFEGALTEARAAIEIFPNNYLAYFYMGLIYDLSENPDEALIALQKCIEIKPDFLQAYMLQGKVLVSIDRRSEARKLYGKVMEIGKGTREAQIAAIQLKQLRPWRGTFSLSQTYNSNISYGVTAEPTFQSGYGLNFTYVPWRTKKGGLNIGGSISENIYYNPQLTGTGLSLSVSGDYSPDRNKILSAALSQSRGFLESRRTSKGFNATVSLRIIPRAIPTSFIMDYDFSASRSLVNKTSDTDTHRIGLSVSQSLGLKDSISGGYNFSVNINKDPLGSNYGNRTNNISISYNRSFFSQYSLSLSYSAGFVQYMNPDSTTLFHRFRRNIRQTVGGGISFPLSEQISFSLRYNYTNNQTNLPRPTAELRQTLEDILAAPIPTVGGSYEAHTMTISLRVNF